MNVLCSHKMNTTKFVCKDPEHGDGRRFHIQVFAGQPVLVDERIVAAFPTTFTVIQQPEIAPDADDSDQDDNSDTGADDSESLDPVALDENKEPSLDDTVTDLVDGVELSEVEVENAKEAADEVDAEILKDVIAEAEADVKEDAENENEKFVEPDTDIPNVTEDIVAEEKAYAEVELMATIDGFKTRKKLDVWGAGIGITLDGRKSLTNMKADAKKALNLG